MFRLIGQTVATASLLSLILETYDGLFRALLMMFALLAALALVGQVWALCVHPARLAPFALWTGLFAGATLIAYVRCGKRSEDFAQAVFDLILVAGRGDPAPRNPS